jgi:hypothetical protein
MPSSRHLLRLSIVGLLLLGLGLAHAAPPTPEPARVAEKAGPYAARTLDRGLRRHVFETRRAALAAHLEHLRAREAARPATRTSLSPRARTMRLVRYLAERLARRAVALRPTLLPPVLPLLPATNAGQRQVQAVIDEGIARTRTARELYLYLERQTSVLRGSIRPADQALARELVSYLAGYKESWADAWISGQLFAAAPATGQRGPAVRFAHDGRAREVAVPLPPLPATQLAEADVQRVIDAGIAATRQDPTPKALLVYLEGQVHELRAQNQRPLARQLSRYLGRYRKQWTAAWLSPAERARVRRAVASGGARLSQLANANLLHRVLQTEVVISPYYSVSGILASTGPRRRINIVPSPGGTTRDTLHELGHIIEDGDERIHAAVYQGVLRERAYGSAPKHLGELIPNTSYGPGQRGLAGGFLDPYMGRHYPQGWTEILSTALERLETPRTALDFFKSDGWHFLTAVSALRGPTSR